MSVPLLLLLLLLLLLFVAVVLKRALNNIIFIARAFAQLFRGLLRLAIHFHSLKNYYCTILIKRSKKLNPLHSLYRIIEFHRSFQVVQWRVE